MIIESQDPMEGMANLEENKQHHNRIRTLMTYIDDRMKYLVLIFYFAAIIGALIPIIQIWQLFSHDELSTKYKIALPVILIVTVYVLGYSLYKAFMIPLEFENAIKLYYLKVGYTKFQNREKGFHEEVTNFCFLNNSSTDITIIGCSYFLIDNFFIIVQISKRKCVLRNTKSYLRWYFLIKYWFCNLYCFTSISARCVRVN
jgi:hypothetical protein